MGSPTREQQPNITNGDTGWERWEPMLLTIWPLADRWETKFPSGVAVKVFELGWVVVSLPGSPELWRAQLRGCVAARIGGSLALPWSRPTDGREAPADPSPAINVVVIDIIPQKKFAHQR